MTSLLGKWKLCLLLFVMGSYAFAKAETHPSTVLCNDFITVQAKTFTIDLNFDRNDIFALFKDLKTQYGISSSINAYKRKSGVTSKLGLEFITKSGKSYKIFEEKEEGIKEICLEIDALTMEIIYFDHCDVNADSSIAVGKNNPTQIDKPTNLKTQPLSDIQDNESLDADLLEQQITDAKKEKAALRLEIARAKSEKLKEEKRIAILHQKEELAASIAAVKRRTEQAETDALEARKKQCSFCENYIFFDYFGTYYEV